MAEDLKDFRFDRQQDLTNVQGVLYRGDAATKYSKPNIPIYRQYRSVVPKELAIVNDLSNETEASQFMLRAMDLDPNTRSVHPTVPSIVETTNFLIPAERHDAYAFMWNSLTYCGVVANAAMWLYL